MKENQRVIITPVYSPFCGCKGRLLRKRKNKRFGYETWYVQFEKPIKRMGTEIEVMQFAEHCLAVIPEDYGELYNS